MAAGTAPKGALAKQSMRDFPWWIVIILGMFSLGLLYVLSNPELSAYYASAFTFIWPGVWVTLQVTFFSYILALIIGLFVGLLRLSTNPVVFHLCHRLRGDDARPAHAGDRALRRVCGAPRPAGSDRWRGGCFHDDWAPSSVWALATAPFCRRSFAAASSLSVAGRRRQPRAWA